MQEFSKYVGLDTYKDTIAVAIAEIYGGKTRYYGEIPNTPGAITKLVKKRSPNGEVLSFCYEAGPCGYGIYRQLMGLGHVCNVVAPSLIPSRPDDRKKTDWRDREMLARLHRAGKVPGRHERNRASNLVTYEFFLAPSRQDLPDRLKQVDTGPF